MKDPPLPLNPTKPPSTTCKLAELNQFAGLNLDKLPPTTRHVSSISSPSSFGPIIVLFMTRPHRSRITGGSGGTGSGRVGGWKEKQD